MDKNFRPVRMKTLRRLMLKFNELEFYSQRFIYKTLKTNTATPSSLVIFSYLLPCFSCVLLLFWFLCCYLSRCYWLLVIWLSLCYLGVYLPSPIFIAFYVVMTFPLPTTVYNLCHYNLSSRNQITLVNRAFMISQLSFFDQSKILQF